MAVTRTFRPKHLSQFTHLYTDAPDGSALTIYLDQQLSRRKRFHVIVSAKGATLFRSRFVSDCIRWLDNEEVEQYTIDAGGCSVVVNGRSAQAHLGKKDTTDNGKDHSPAAQL